MSNSILDIKDILNEYSFEIQESIALEAERLAKEGKNTLKKTSPKDKRNSKRRGRYAKGWRVQTTKGRGFIECTIHNKTDYQLTHLLENPHLTRNGGLYVPKEKHIAPVHDKIVNDFQNRVEEIIKNGGNQ